MKRPIKAERKNPKEVLDSFQTIMEGISKGFQEGIKIGQKKLEDPKDRNYIIVKRMVDVRVRKDQKGYCDNITESDLKGGEMREEVRAGDTMCSVGMVRKGRSWGDYGGVFCCECPYFIFPKGVKNEREK